LNFSTRPRYHHDNSVLEVYLSKSALFKQIILFKSEKGTHEHTGSTNVLKYPTLQKVYVYITYGESVVPKDLYTVCLYRTAYASSFEVF
jgi:hypothetical protein